MSAPEIRLTGGDRVIVKGTIEQVEKLLSDAARSGQSRLAWLTELDADRPIAVNPTHVISLRQGSPDGGDGPA